MKTLILALILATLLPLAAQKKLTPSDREALLDELVRIRKDANAKVDARFDVASRAFRNAAGSPDAAFDLYLKCEEMVSFDEMRKKNVDFREWRRNNDNWLSDPGFHLALQQQLRWLILTLEAASEKPDRDKLGVEAAKIVNSIVAQAEDLSRQQEMLEQEVTSSIFARAYDINGLKVKSWPLSLSPLAEVYEQVLLPPLRRADMIDALKEKWKQRMIDEGVLVQAWSGRPGEKPKTGQQSPAFDKFVSEIVPKLKWNTEIDLFKVGDEQAAAIRMLKHIEDNLTHQSAPEWSKDFAKMIKVNDSAESALGLDSPEVVPTTR